MQQTEAADQTNGFKALQLQSSIENGASREPSIPAWEL